MTFDDLLPDLLVEVNGCPRVTAESHMRRAAREFCERTHVWTVTLATVDAQPDTVEYTLPLPAGSTLVRLSQVDLGDEKDICILDEQEAKAELGRGSQSYFAWLDGAQLHINPAPMSVLPLVVQCSLKPTLTADSIPDWIAEDHAETLRMGAKGTLLSMLKVDWSDPLLSEVVARDFRGRCNAAAIRKTKGRAALRRRSATFY